MECRVGGTGTALHEAVQPGQPVGQTPSKQRRTNHRYGISSPLLLCQKFNSLNVVQKMAR